MKINFDPVEEVKLRQAAEEIRAVLRRHDIGGIINLQGKDTAHYLLEITPSWSCVRLEKSATGGFVVRFQAAVTTGGPAEKERARWSTGMIMGFLDIIEVQKENLTAVAMMIGKHLGIEHGAGPFEEPK